MSDGTVVTFGASTGLGGMYQHHHHLRKQALTWLAWPKDEVWHMEMHGTSEDHNMTG